MNTNKIKIGWGEVSLVPEGRKISLAGQFFERISDEVESPLSVVAMAVESGIMGYSMCKNNKNLCDGDGIIGYGVENTIKNVGTLASQGMRETDNVIIKIMTEQN